MEHSDCSQWLGDNNRPQRRRNLSSGSGNYKSQARHSHMVSFSAAEDFWGTTVSWEVNIQEAYERKYTKYTELKADCVNRGWKATCYPFEIDAEVSLQPPSRSGCVTLVLVEGRWLSWARKRQERRRQVQRGYGRSMYRRADEDFVAVFQVYVNQQEVITNMRTNIQMITNMQMPSVLLWVCHYFCLA